LIFFVCCVCLLLMSCHCFSNYRNVGNSLAGAIELIPELTDSLLSLVDQPLKIVKDESNGKEFVVCDYNRDGDGYRSPWSNKYFEDEKETDGFLPSAHLRQMEIEANKVFDTYRKQYFDTGYSSVYFFETNENDQESFGACWLIHKVSEATKNLKQGWWDSIHVFEVTPEAGVKDSFEYKLTTTAMVSMILQDDHCGTVDLSGSMTQQATKKSKIDKFTSHIANMGKMLEATETTVRNKIENIYIQKTRQVISGIRAPSGSRDKQWADITSSLNARIGLKK
jgi:capping protein beta